MGPERTPADHLGDEASRRIARSFLLVRVVRGGLLLVFLATALWGAHARGWPGGILVAIGAAAVLQAATLAADVRRLRTTRGEFS